MELFFLLIYLLSVYATYYNSQRYKANPYLWTTIGIFFNVFGFIFSLIYFRKKKVQDPRPNLRPLGFRSKSIWKMAAASLIYLMVSFVALGVFIGVGTGAESSISEHGAEIETEIGNAGTVDEIVENSDQQSEESQIEQGMQDNSSSQSSDILEPSQKGSKDNTPGGQMKVHFIDVGQADSILIQQGGKNMLIDAGNNDDANTIINYLKKNGVDRLDFVVATHPHEDHIGSMDQVIKTFEIGTVYASSAKSTTKTYKDFINAVKDKGLKLNKAVSGTQFNLGDAKAVILAPNSESYEDLNNYSVVVKLTYGQNKFIFQGDAEDVSENEILSRGYDISADVIKVGHHGSSSSSTASYLSKVKPKYAVISVGKDNSYGHPAQSVMARLKSMGINVYRTDQSGTILCVSDGKNISFNVKPGDYSYGTSNIDTTDKTAKVTPSSTPDSSSKSSTGGEKVYVDSNGKGLIKGNINSSGEKIYHMPGGLYYDKTIAEEWFKTESEAQAAGYRKSKR